MIFLAIVTCVFTAWLILGVFVMVAVEAHAKRKHQRLADHMRHLENLEAMLDEPHDIFMERIKRALDGRELK